MSLDRNLDDLRRHADDFEARTGFTFTVLEPVTGDVIGCVYLYPSESPDADVTVQSWVRASHAELDGPLADAVAAWLAAEWPWERVHRPGRQHRRTAWNIATPPTDTNGATLKPPRQIATAMKCAETDLLVVPQNAAGWRRRRPAAPIRTRRVEAFRSAGCRSWVHVADQNSWTGAGAVTWAGPRSEPGPDPDLAKLGFRGG